MWAVSHSTTTNWTWFRYFTIELMEHIYSDNYFCKFYYQEINRHWLMWASVFYKGEYQNKKTIFCYSKKNKERKCVCEELPLYTYAYKWHFLYKYKYIIRPQCITQNVCEEFCVRLRRWQLNARVACGTASIAPLFVWLTVEIWICVFNKAQLILSLSPQFCSHSSVRLANGNIRLWARVNCKI